MTDPYLPPSSPPTPPSVPSPPPPPSFPPSYPPSGSSFPPVPPPPSGGQPLAPAKKQRKWPVFLAAGIGAGIVAAISFVAFGNSADDDADATLPDVERDVERSGWVLEAPPEWVAVDVDGVEAAWAVGGGSDTFGNNVTVLVEKSPMSTLEAYLNYSAELSDVALGAPTTVVSSEVVAGSDGELGRLEVTSQGDEPLHVLAYVMETKEGFVSVTYAATEDTYAGQVADIEAVLQTLHGA